MLASARQQLASENLSRTKAAKIFCTAIEIYFLIAKYVVWFIALQHIYMMESGL
jgi:hypothetical protein